MTGITDDEAAEVLWASSEQGKAAVRAAWARWEQIRQGAPELTSGIQVLAVDRADIGAVVYAAYQAGRWAGGGAGGGGGEWT